MTALLCKDEMPTFKHHIFFTNTFKNHYKSFFLIEFEYLLTENEWTYTIDKSKYQSGK